MEISSTVNEPSNYDAGLAAYHRGHYEVAMYDFESRAMKGDPVAQFCLGFMYKHGKGVPEDLIKAVEWYEKAAEQNCTPAQNNLGVTLIRIEEDVATMNYEIESGVFARTASKWFREAAEQNNPSAQYNIALVSTIAAEYHFPEYSEEPIALYQNAVVWYKKAAEQGYAPAQNELARIYQFGLGGVNQDLEKAVELYIKAADPDPKAVGTGKNGHAIAQFNLAAMYHNGDGLKQDFTEAIKWYREAAAQGLALGQFNFAIMYDEGQGVDQDFKEAARWYQTAAAQGYAPAQNRLAVMYYDGKGVLQNFEKALRLIFEAAQQGEAIAQSNLGQTFEEGIDGVPSDDEEAYYWYSLAAQNKAGLDNAQNDNLVTKVSKARETIGNRLSVDQRNEIQKQVDNWKPKYRASSGTGFYISKNHILTNAHVVRSCDELRIPYHRVEIIAVDEEIDLALLFDPRGNMEPATFRSYPVDFGEDIVVFGYPLSSVLSYGGNGTFGSVSGLSSMIDDSHPDNLFQHTAPTQGGNSGGPVLDSAGNVVGVVVSSLNPDLVWHQNVNFAIKFNVIEDFLKQNGADCVTFQQMIISGENTTIIHRKTAAINKEEIYVKAEKFTVPVLCFVNKMAEPLPLAEIGIDELKQ